MKKFKIGALVEKKDIDGFWVVPDREGFGIIVSRDEFYSTRCYVLWQDGILRNMHETTLQPWGTRNNEMDISA